MSEICLFQPIFAMQVVRWHRWKASDWISVMLDGSRRKQNWPGKYLPKRCNHFNRKKSNRFESMVKHIETYSIRSSQFAISPFSQRKYFSTFQPSSHGSINGVKHFCRCKHQPITSLRDISWVVWLYYRVQNRIHWMRRMRLREKCKLCKMWRHRKYRNGSQRTHWIVTFCYTIADIVILRCEWTMVSVKPINNQINI